MPKILVVDDDGMISKSTKKILEAHMSECEVIVAKSGQEGIDKALLYLPDVILVDIVMPDVDGYDVCRAIRSDDTTKHIPIIAVTGHVGNIDVKVNILTAGADAFITKPITTPELIAQTNAMLRIKEAEDLLREELDYNRLKVLDSNQNIRKVYEASFEGIVIVADNNIISANKKFCSLYGYDYKEVIGKPITDFITRGDRSRLLKDLESGCSLECSYSGINKNGTVLYFEVRQELVTCDDAPAVLLVMHDITELKRIEHRIESLLALSEKKFESEEAIAKFALDEAVKLTNSEVGYLHFVNNGQVYANMDDITLDLFVWSSDIEPKCGIDRTIHFPLKDAGVWADCVRTRQPSIHNDYLNIEDKKEYPIGHFPITRHMSVPVLNGGDALVAVMGVGNKTDPYTEFDVHQLQLFANSMWYIIKRKRLDLELKSYLDLAPAIFVALDRTGAIKALNRFGREVLECSDECIGQNWFEKFISNNDRLSTLKVFNDLLSGKDRFSTVENEVITDKGNIRIISWRNTVLLNNHGGIETVLAAGEDITERRLAEKELENHWQKERIRLEDNLKQLSILGSNVNKPKELASKND